MRDGLKRLVYKHVLHNYPTWRKFQFERIATTNWDSLGDPETFLSRALKNDYINGETPEQIWTNLRRLCSDLKVPRADEQIEAFRRLLAGAQTSGGDDQPAKEGVPYVHDEVYFNLVAPRIIAAKLYPILRPRSVADVGCGLGTFLAAFKESGAQTVQGYDGDWVNRELLLKYISLSEFKAIDLQDDFATDGAKFDLVISLEVAEHLRPESADRFIKNLVSLGDVLLFSAATPATWFDSSHLNNQWPDYWRDKFASHGYFMHDVVRHIFLDDEDVCVWYRTNMFLVTKGKDTSLPGRLLQISPENVDRMKRSNEFYPMLTPNS